MEQLIRGMRSLVRKKKNNVNSKLDLKSKPEPCNDLYDYMYRREPLNVIYEVETNDDVFDSEEIEYFDRASKFRSSTRSQMSDVSYATTISEDSFTSVSSEGSDYSERTYVQSDESCNYSSTEEQYSVTPVKRVMKKQVSFADEVKGVTKNAVFRTSSVQELTKLANLRYRCQAAPTRNESDVQKRYSLPPIRNEYDLRKRYSLPLTTKSQNDLMYSWRQVPESIQSQLVIMINTTLKSYLEGKMYNSQFCAQFSKLLSEMLTAHAAEIASTDNYRIITQVYVGEVSKYGLAMASQSQDFLAVDLYASGNYKYQNIYAAAIIYGVYMPELD